MDIMRLFVALLLSLGCMTTRHVRADSSSLIQDWHRRTSAQRYEFVGAPAAPSIILLDFDVKNEFAKTREANTKSLKACGFNVVEKRLTAKEAREPVESLLENLPMDVPILATGFHSIDERKKDELFPTGLDFHIDGCRVPGLPFLSKLEKARPKSPIFLDTCHAGVCHVVGSSRIATTCLHSEKSASLRDGTEQTRNERELIHVLCDSINSCKIFNGVRKKDDSGWERWPYDENADGFIDGKELTKYFKEKFKSSRSLTSHSTSLLLDSMAEAERSKKECDKRGLTAKISPLETLAYKMLTTRFNAEGKKLFETSTYYGESERPKGYKEGADNSLIWAKEVVRLPDPFLEGRYLRPVDVRLIEGKAEVEGRFVLKEGAPLTPGPNVATRFHMRISHEVSERRFLLVCDGGHEAPAISNSLSNSSSVQYPIFPPEFRIRCRRNTARRMAR